MMLAVAVSAGIITALYVGFVLAALTGIQKSTADYPFTSRPVSLIVAFRNERKNLEKLFQSFKNQEQPPSEIILVNDHSTDLEGFQFPPHIKVLLNEGAGKKDAVTTGVKHATGELMVFTDADCVHEPGWLQHITAPLEEKNNGLVIGAVVPVCMKSFFALDDLSISAATMGMARLHKPFACSGASMACRKSDFIAWKPYETNLAQQSGDDVYLMHACLKNGKKVHAITYTESLTFHPSAPSLGAFLRQRMRWGQKTGTATMGSLWVGLLVNLYSLILYAGLVLCFVNLKLALICMVGLILGAIVNFLFLFLVALRWKLRPNWLLFLPNFIFHLGYIPWVAILGKIWPLQWKGRSVKSSN